MLHQGPSYEGPHFFPVSAWWRRRRRLLGPFVPSLWFMQTLRWFHPSLFFPIGANNSTMKKANNISVSLWKYFLPWRPPEKGTVDPRECTDHAENPSPGETLTQMCKQTERCHVICITIIQMSINRRMVSKIVCIHSVER